MKSQMFRSISKKEALLWCALIALLFAGIGCNGGSASMPTPGTGHCYGIDQRPAELHATQRILHTRIRYGAFRAGAYRPACG